MPTLVVPFRGTAGKRRLRTLPDDVRTALARAMLEDVVAACAGVGQTFVVAPGAAAPEGAVAVDDPGRGQGAAVAAGLDAAVAAGGAAPFLVVNADLPCVTPRDLFTLAGAVPDDGLVFVAARDGTTNALALAASGLFEPVYGPGSAERFAALAPSRALDLENLRDDVDTVRDLELLGERAGPRTRAAARRVRPKAAV
jgi:2-phospho-L-lactate/phosphoenolpyruvate guanylyltransferase